MKTINNAMLQVYFSGLDELLPLAKHAGIPFEKVISILLTGPAGIPMLKDRLPKILGEDDTVGFTVAAAHKDNTVFQSVAKAAARETPILKIAGTRQASAIKAGLAENDPAALVRFAYDRT
jgi:3-hydroxyisobutyrate dehydrogenase-like beta-hydroxyacid dehydrogenase